MDKSNERLIAMGQGPVMEGFALLGFETFADPDIEDLQNLLNDLMIQEEKAFILLESYLSASGLKLLQEVRDTATDIIIAEIPAINHYEDYHPYVEQLIAQSLGQQVLDNKSDIPIAEMEAQLEEINTAEKQLNNHLENETTITNDATTWNNEQ